MSRESRRDRGIVGVDRDDVDQAVLYGTPDPTRIVVPSFDIGRHDLAVDGFRDDLWPISVRKNVCDRCNLRSVLYSDSMKSEPILDYSSASASDASALIVRLLGRFS